MNSKANWDDTLPEKGSEAWQRATTKEKEEAIRHATQFLDTLPYKGERKTETQALAWPRKGVFRDDGLLITGVPAEIKKAVSLVAGFILAKIPCDVPALAWVMANVGHLLKEDTDLVNLDVTWH